MTEDGGQKTDPVVQEELSKRIACLYDMIRSAESSRCLVDWIGTPENLQRINWGGYGQLFGHIQYVAYCDFILNTVNLFERDKRSSSFRSLFDYIIASKSKIKTTGFSRATAEEKHSEEYLCSLIHSMRNRLPVWPHNGFDPELESLDHALGWMKIKRDEVIAHREFKNAIAPRATIDLVADGGGLLSLAIDLYDQIFRIAASVCLDHFKTSKINGDGKLASVRHISKKFENVVAGKFAKKRISGQNPLIV